MLLDIDPNSPIPIYDQIVTQVIFQVASGALEPGGYPARVTIFKDTHERSCATWEDLVEEVRRTVLHEVGHHFLMDEDEMPY